VTFGVLADAQFAVSPPSGSRFYDSSWLKVRAALDVFNGRGVRFVVHLGDLIDHDAASYDLILQAFAHSRAHVRFVLGNHDFDVAPELRAGVLSRLGIGRGYYAFPEGRFIVSTATSWGSPRREARRRIEEMFAAWLPPGVPTPPNGTRRLDQLAFLDAEPPGPTGTPACGGSVTSRLSPAGHNFGTMRPWSPSSRNTLGQAYFSGHNHAGDFAVKAASPTRSSPLRRDS
jgi:hypothetical protein